MSPNRIESAREQFRPTPVRVLFLAEAPPADPSRFFYFEQVATGDSLFIELMRQLYSDARNLLSRELRSRKPEYLARFRADGYFLTDAQPDPMPSGIGAAQKMRLLRQGLPALLAQIKDVVIPSTRLVLISSTVYQVCGKPLREAGLKVLNTEMIDFPGSGRQGHFRRKLGALLARHGLVR